MPNILSTMVLNLPSSMATGRSPMETCQDCWQPSPGLHASQPFPTECCYQNAAAASPLLVGLCEQWLHHGPKKLITFNNYNYENNYKPRPNYAIGS